MNRLSGSTIAKFDQESIKTNIKTLKGLFESLEPLNPVSLLEWLEALELATRDDPRSFGRIGRSTM